MSRITATDNRRASRVAARREVPDAFPFERNYELKQWAVEVMVALTDTSHPIVKGL